MKYKILFLFLIGILISCNKGDVIEEEKFVEIYSKLIIAKEKYKEGTPKFVEERKQILSKYQVTEEQIKSTLDYYSKDPYTWKEFLEKTIIYLEDLKKQKLN